MTHPERPTPSEVDTVLIAGNVYELFLGEDVPHHRQQHAQKIGREKMEALIRNAATLAVDVYTADSREFSGFKNTAFDVLIEEDDAHEETSILCTLEKQFKGGMVRDDEHALTCRTAAIVLDPEAFGINPDDIT